MSYALEGRRVLVTGASTGIGAALAEGFARAGAVVGICARRESMLGEVLQRIRQYSPHSKMWAVDLADLEGIEGFARRVEAELGGVDVLVNNAGMPKRRRVQELTPEVVEAVMSLNYFSPVRLTLALLSGLVERQGRIVNISSVAARLGPPGEAAYTASKAALTGWSESMHVDLAPVGVKVHVVNPGVIDTDLFHLPDNDPGPTGIEALPVSAIVQPVLDQLESGTFEIYVPDWFVGIVDHKFPDTDAYLEGTIQWAHANTGESG
ncbi:SDR family oxidoreductase [Myxococcota bacterium]|nr:SDR family oxidoreductase [Myxococcota bacterium]